MTAFMTRTTEKATAAMPLAQSEIADGFVRVDIVNKPGSLLNGLYS